MSDILLTDKEISQKVKAWVKNDSQDRLMESIAQAQLRKCLEWMEERDFWISKDDVQELRKAAGL